MAKIYVSWPGYSASEPATGARLVAAGHELVLCPKLGMRTAEELISLMSGCAAAIVSTDPFTAAAIRSNSALKVIARVGVGTDSIDLAVARQQGVAVSITPGMNADTVAEHTVALILALIRKVVQQDFNVRNGRWERVGQYTPSELAGKTVGLIGAGSIGRALIKRLIGFGVTIIYFDTLTSDINGANRVESIQQVLADSDIVSLHVPLTAGTARLINAQTIAQMKTTALLINTARGGLIDQAALFAALRGSSIGGAALDVFAEEPPRPLDLEAVPNLIVSAHVGGLSDASIRRMTISATDSVLDVLQGKVPSSLVTSDSLVEVGS